MFFNSIVFLKIIFKILYLKMQKQFENFPDVNIYYKDKKIKTAELFNNDKEEECLICMCEENLSKTKLVCNHFFHEECINNWLNSDYSYSDNCPYCRQCINFNTKIIEVIDWERISHHQKLSEDFIREFKDKVDWENISACKKLSEDFIREFKDKVDWEYSSGCQNYQKNLFASLKIK